MPKRRRFTPLKNKTKSTPKKDEERIDPEVSTARGRLKGALMEIMGPSQSVQESDHSSDYGKRERRINSSDESSEEEERPQNGPQRQSYVLKLFDRSVDLSQFNDNTPLYPICRAWMINQPKADYSKVSILNPHKEETKERIPDKIDLPGPEGPVISRVPDLIPEQKAVNKDNINLIYDNPLPTKGQLLAMNMKRWSKVRGAWLEQGLKVHERYAKTQEVLNRLNINGP
ncbi:unnamed protein product [Leptosia nina]|uniref:Protein lin-37 homolog n=1 Tax=Leptosia nina TaxID=320188 RepID=A0AAV1JT37_9NEOP